MSDASVMYRVQSNDNHSSLHSAALHWHRGLKGGGGSIWNRIVHVLQSLFQG